jgi:hypothetical protein
MKYVRHLTVVVLLLVAMRPAAAANVIYPPGVRVGLSPAVGLSLAKSFTGFQSDDQSVKVLVTELPPNAYDEVKTAFAKPDAVGPTGIKPQTIETKAGPAYYTVEVGKDGANTVQRYSMILPGGTFSGYVAAQVPANATKILSEDVIRAMFATATVRKEVPVTEQLSLMPFNVTQLGNFKNVRTLAPGAAVIIGMIGHTPPEQADRTRLAQEAATQIPGVRDAKVTVSEPIRVAGQPAYETRIDAISGKDNTSVTVVQWLVFGGANMLRIVGSAPRDQWTSAFPRFRAVRDGVQPRG